MTTFLKAYLVNTDNPFLMLKYYLESLEDDISKMSVENTKELFNNLVPSNKKLRRKYWITERAGDKSFKNISTRLVSELNNKLKTLFEEFPELEKKEDGKYIMSYLWRDIFSPTRQDFLERRERRITNLYGIKVGIDELREHLQGKKEDPSKLKKLQRISTIISQMINEIETKTARKTKEQLQYTTGKVKQGRETDRLSGQQTKITTGIRSIISTIKSLKRDISLSKDKDIVSENRFYSYEIEEHLSVLNQNINMAFIRSTFNKKFSRKELQRNTAEVELYKLLNEKITYSYLPKGSQNPKERRGTIFQAIEDMVMTYRKIQEFSPEEKERIVGGKKGKDLKDALRALRERKEEEIVSQKVEQFIAASSEEEKRQVSNELSNYPKQLVSEIKEKRIREIIKPIVELAMQGDISIGEFKDKINELNLNVSPYHIEEIKELVEEELGTQSVKIPRFQSIVSPKQTERREKEEAERREKEVQRRKDAVEGIVGRFNEQMKI